MLRRQWRFASRFSFDVCVVDLVFLPRAHKQHMEKFMAAPSKEDSMLHTACMILGRGFQALGACTPIVCWMHTCVYVFVWL
jgi:hypothetical protein